MDSQKQSVKEILLLLRQGDEEGAQALWDQFFPRLAQKAQAQLRNKSVHNAEGEDVALSVLASLCEAARNHSERFDDLEDDASLWRLLSSMAYRKVISRLRKNNAQKSPRIVDELPDDPLGSAPTPEMENLLAESVHEWLAVLTDEERVVALRKLEGYTNKEIGAEIGRGLRTVDRRLDTIRIKWRRRGAT